MYTSNRQNNNLNTNLNKSSPIPDRQPNTNPEPHPEPSYSYINEFKIDNNTGIYYNADDTPYGYYDSEMNFIYLDQEGQPHPPTPSPEPDLNNTPDIDPEYFEDSVDPDYRPATGHNPTYQPPTTAPTKSNLVPIYIILAILSLVIGGGGYMLYNKISQQPAPLARVLEFDDNGNIISGYTQDMEPIISPTNPTTTDPNKPTLGKVKRDPATNYPLVTVRSYDKEGNIIKTQVIVKSSEGIIKTEEELAEVKAQQAKLKKEAEDKQRQKILEDNRLAYAQDFSIKSLPEEFFTYNPLDSAIPESKYRDLKLIPKSEESNPFIIYNYNGNLVPYKAEGYTNRDVIGKSLTLEAIKALNITITPNPNLNNIEIAMAPAPQAIEAEINKALDKLIKLNIYPDLDPEKQSIYTSDTLTKITDAVPDDNTIRETIIWNSFTANNSDPRTTNYQKIYSDLKIDINKSKQQILKPEIIAKYFKKVYELETAYKLNQNKLLACAEINKFAAGQCPDAYKISTLEIKPDYIEQTYQTALSEAFKSFIRLSSIAYYEIMNP